MPRDRSPLACQAVRIAGAMHPLVVLQHGLGDGCRKIDLFKHFVAHPGVGSDYGRLYLIQPARLAQYLDGDDYLADVMQQASHVDPGDPVLRQSKLVGQGGGELRHPLLMSRGMAIPHLNHQGDHLDGLFQHLPETGDPFDYDPHSGKATLSPGTRVRYLKVPYDYRDAFLQKLSSIFPK